MRTVLEVAEVREGENGAPRVVRWRGTAHRVMRLLDDWESGGEWWAGRCGHSHWLVECVSGLVLEVQRGEDGAWLVARVSD